MGTFLKPTNEKVVAEETPVTEESSKEEVVATHLMFMIMRY